MVVRGLNKKPPLLLTNNEVIMIKIVVYILAIIYITLMLSGCAELLEAYSQNSDITLTGDVETDYSKLIYIITGMAATLLSGFGVKKYREKQNRRF
jgi:hypothetical protein